MNEPQQSVPGEVESRVAYLAAASNLAWMTALLTAQRDVVLDRWLELTAAQPFHQGRREQAVADHIPRLYDALVAYLQRAAPPWVVPDAPLADAGVQAAARDHAHMRAEQGLLPVDIVVEFRLLRQEIWRSLRTHLPDAVPMSDVLAGQLLVNDALDGAITVGLSALMDRIEEVREDFLATTVHEVRHPVTAIKAGAQMGTRFLTRAQPNLERTRVQLERIEAAAERMERLLTILTDASRLALGHLELAPTTVDLVPLLREVIGRFEPPIDGRVVPRLPADGTATGHWDAARLEQVVGNLLSNAVKYSPPDTPIEVTISSTPDVVRLSVRDRGIGIAPEELPRLFQRYARARGATPSNADGLGLGLYLSRGLVEAHGGRIWAESAGRQQGATFHVELPRTPPEGRDALL